MDKGIKCVTYMSTAVVLCFETVVLQNKTNNRESSLLYSSSSNKTPVIHSPSSMTLPLSPSQIGLCDFTIHSLEDFIVISWLPLDEIIVYYNSIFLNGRLFFKKPFKMAPL